MRLDEDQPAVDPEVAGEPVQGQRIHRLIARITRFDPVASFQRLQDLPRRAWCPDLWGEGGGQDFFQRRQDMALCQALNRRVRRVRHPTNLPASRTSLESWVPGSTPFWRDAPHGRAEPKYCPLFKPRRHD